MTTTITATYIELDHTTTPTQPAKGVNKIYVKNDNKIYFLTGGNVETDFTGGVRAMSDFSDITFGTLNDGDYLIYTDGDWVDSTIAAANVTNMADFNDVNSDTPQSGWTIVYDNNLSSFRPRALLPGVVASNVGSYLIADSTETNINKTLKLSTLGDLSIFGDSFLIQSNGTGDYFMPHEIDGSTNDLGAYLLTVSGKIQLATNPMDLTVKIAEIDTGAISNLTTVGQFNITDYKYFYITFPIKATSGYNYSVLFDKADDTDATTIENLYISWEKIGHSLS